MSQELTEKMNPCPFCNSTDVDSRFALCASGEISAGCMTCGACGPQSSTEEMAVVAWNCCASGLVLALKKATERQGFTNNELITARQLIAKHTGGAK